MTETKPKPSTSRIVPRILWSNHSHRHYSGPVTSGFVASDGYMDQALRIAQGPEGFLDVDVEKASRILKASRIPSFIQHAERLTRVLEGRLQPKPMQRGQV